MCCARFFPNLHKIFPKILGYQENSRQIPIFGKGGTFRNIQTSVDYHDRIVKGIQNQET